jgi:hypothetical protein
MTRMPAARAAASRPPPEIAAPSLRPRICQRASRVLCVSVRPWAGERMRNSPYEKFYLRRAPPTNTCGDAAHQPGPEVNRAAPLPPAGRAVPRPARRRKCVGAIGPIPGPRRYLATPAAISGGGSDDCISYIAITCFRRRPCHRHGRRMAERRAQRAPPWRLRLDPRYAFPRRDYRWRCRPAGGGRTAAVRGPAWPRREQVLRDKTKALTL